MEMKDEYIGNGGVELDIENMIEQSSDKFKEFFGCLQVNQHKNLVLIRYGIEGMSRGMWDDKDSPYRECRSLVIDLENEAIVCCPFRKFFNLNEVEENKLENIEKEIKKCQKYEVSNKLDGSMQSFTYYRGEILGFGSMAIDPEKSWRLKDGFYRLTENHKRLIKSVEDTTFIFEYISLNDAHVVEYTKEEEGLYLIGIRNNCTGYEFSYELIQKISKEYGIKCTETYNLTLSELIHLSKTLKADIKEGWVLNIDGHKVKLKTDDYVGLHTLLDKLISPNVIIKAIYNGTWDDLSSKIPERHRRRADEIYNAVDAYVTTTINFGDTLYNSAPKDDRKTFMIWVDTKVPKKLRTYIKNKYLGRPYHPLLKGSSNALGLKKLGDMGIKLEE